MAALTGQSVLEDKLFKYLNIGVFVTVNLLYLYLAVHRNFSYDEAYTVGMVNRDFADIFKVTSRDVHSPFYYIVLKIFYAFPGMGQLISAKIFSWIFMVFYLLGGVFPAGKSMGER